MSQGNELLRAILMNPACDTTRLVYADWLQENGDPERAEFIRAGCRLKELQNQYLDAVFDEANQYKNPPRNAVMDSLSKEVRQMADKNAVKWFDLSSVTRSHNPKRRTNYRVTRHKKYGDVNVCFSTPDSLELFRRFHYFGVNRFLIDRGFIAAISMNPFDFIRNAPGLFSNHPIQAVDLYYASPSKLGDQWTWYKGGFFWDIEIDRHEEDVVPCELWCDVTGDNDMRWPCDEPHDCFEKLARNAIEYGRMHSVPLCVRE